MSDLDGLASDQLETPASRDTGLTSIGVMPGTARSVYTLPRAGVTLSADIDPATNAVEPDPRR